MINVKFHKGKSNLGSRQTGDRDSRPDNYCIRQLEAKIIDNLTHVVSCMLTTSSQKGVIGMMKMS